MGSSSDSGFPIRPLAGALFLIGGNVVLFRSFAGGDVLGLLVAVGVLTIGGRLLAPTIAGWVAEPAGHLFYPGHKLKKPAPAFSVPRARRAFGKFDEAIDELRKIGQEHPEELEAWVEMIDIALVDLNDPDRALALYHEGQAAQTSPEKRETLGRTFQAMMARYKQRREREARDASPRIDLPPEGGPDKGA